MSYKSFVCKKETMIDGHEMCVNKVYHINEKTTHGNYIINPNDSLIAFFATEKEIVNCGGQV